MKIVDVCEFYSERGGGVRTYVREKLAAGQALGHEVVIIAPGPGDREECVDGGRIVWVKAPVLRPDPRYHFFFDGRPVLRVLEQEAPDVVEASSPWRGGWIASAWRKAPARVLVMHQDPVAVYAHTLASPPLSRDRVDLLAAPFWWYLRRLAARCDATVVAGEWLAQRLSRFGLQNVRSVPMGVDSSFFHLSRASRETRREMLAACGLDEEAKLLVTVGRCHPEKRLDTVIEAVRRAAAEHEIGLYHVGDGPTRAAIERKAAAVPHVHMAGFISDRERMAALVASADALIHGSASETFGLAIAEALCSGTPIIAPDAGGAHDFCDPAYSETYRPGDADSAASAIKRLLQRDLPELRRAAATFGRNRISNPQRHFASLFTFYETLVAPSRQKTAQPSGFKQARVLRIPRTRQPVAEAVEASRDP